MPGQVLRGLPRIPLELHAVTLRATSACPTPRISCEARLNDDGARRRAHQKHLALRQLRPVVMRHLSQASTNEWPTLPSRDRRPTR